MGADAADGSEEDVPHVAAYDPDGEVPLTTALVLAVAEFEGCDPEALCASDRPRLADVVDTDVVDALPESATDAWRFGFDLWGYRVAVAGDGRITVARA